MLTFKICKHAKIPLCSYVLIIKHCWKTFIHTVAFLLWALHAFSSRKPGPTLL